MKKKIIVVDACSTGLNYVEDIIKRGYEPVLVEAHQIGTEEDVAGFRQGRDAAKKTLPPNIKIIKENPDYNEILRQVREVQPLHIIAGSEFGVMLTVRLAHDLGLPGNPIENLSAMTQKDAMHEALKAHGLRYIRGKIVNSVQEAADFYDEIGAKGIVVKRTRGAATQGLHLCDNREDMLRAVEIELNENIDTSTEKNNVLIQERINGREFIVNTVSCNGEHRITSVWEYDKLKLSNGTNAYNYTDTVNKLKIGHSRLIRYAFEVIDAIGIKYGPIHGEYMIDEKGPVLIEVNCRPMGFAMPRKFVDMAFGQHETDS
ncbi:MAG: ATP-grasp domain-containing protein, partial [Selenomonadaceae bacterium]|nr:ATP-grasp domain-containing protein [Selenomonadaceae bacterium]